MTTYPGLPSYTGSKDLHEMLRSLPFQETQPPVNIKIRNFIITKFNGTVHKYKVRKLKTCYTVSQSDTLQTSQFLGLIQWLEMPELIWKNCIKPCWPCGTPVAFHNFGFPCYGSACNFFVLPALILSFLPQKQFHSSSLSCGWPSFLAWYEIPATS